MKLRTVPRSGCVICEIWRSWPSSGISSTIPRRKERNLCPAWSNEAVSSWKTAAEPRTEHPELHPRDRHEGYPGASDSGFGRRLLIRKDQKLRRLYGGIPAGRHLVRSRRAVKSADSIRRERRRGMKGRNGNRANTAFRPKPGKQSSKGGAA